ncbi:MAG TPA: hypothetical protein VK826_04615 [Bacteroidia bacterium]|nr:hypothetical protein [Bacteroidia bacterium]
MDEAKRILRYTLPGLVYLILLIACAIVLKPILFKESLSATVNLGVGEIVGGFILAGGLGYLFSITYFGLYWIVMRWTGLKHIYNHKNVLNSLEQQGKICIYYPDSSPAKIKDNREAWYVVNVYWHSRVKESRAIEGMTNKLDSYYSDITSSLATTFLAVIWSFGTFIAILNHDVFPNASTGGLAFCFALYGLFAILIPINWYRTYKSYEAMINIAFVTEINKEYEQKKKVVDLFLDKLKN